MRWQIPVGTGVTAFALLASGAISAIAQAQPTAAKPVTIAFSDNRTVRSASALQAEMGFYSSLYCVGKPVTGTRTVKQAIAGLRQRDSGRCRSGRSDPQLSAGRNATHQHHANR